MSLFVANKNTPYSSSPKEGVAPTLKHCLRERCPFGMLTKWNGTLEPLQDETTDIYVQSRSVFKQQSSYHILLILMSSQGLFERYETRLRC